MNDDITILIVGVRGISRLHVGKNMFVISSESALVGSSCLGHMV